MRCLLRRKQGLQEKGKDKNMQKKWIMWVRCSSVFCLALGLMTSAVWAGDEYKVSLSKFEKAKPFFDDPSPLYEEKLSLKNVIPAEEYARMTFDVQAMQELWPKVVGFKAPDVVGKIAPEIKPGVYGYEDKEKHPGLKHLLCPEMYRRFGPGEPPLAGNFPEIRIVPTRQYYWALPLAEATLKNKNKTKLDNEGYYIQGTYTAGFPFPTPSGEFRARQILYNWERRSWLSDSGFSIYRTRGMNRYLKVDWVGAFYEYNLRLQGRSIMEPYGWFDKRAEKHKERMISAVDTLEPRDMYGMIIDILSYEEVDRFDLFLLYIPAIRRVKKLSATDSQDKGAGGDAIYEDAAGGFNQKLSKERYPYTCKVIADREYLWPSYTVDGSWYYSEQSGELRNVVFERRPTIVVELIQQDPNFVYNKRIIYFDKETNALLFIENYDRKGRLYRTLLSIQYFDKNMGVLLPSGMVLLDHLDLHSTLQFSYAFPATWISRRHVTMQALLKGRK